MVYNSAISGAGGAMSILNSAPEIINTLITNNSGDGAINFINSPGSSLQFCDFYENEGDNFVGNIPIGLGIIIDSTIYGYDCDEYFNIFENPVYTGTGNNPYALFENSPCIDSGIQDTTGMNIPLHDIVGNDRIVDGREDGNIFIDMGAYEFEIVGVIQNNIASYNPGLHNFPNPFNPTTVISYQLLGVSKVMLSVYNLKGQWIKTLANEEKTAGEYSVIWDGKDRNNRTVPSGIYFYNLKTDYSENTRKMILMK